MTDTVGQKLIQARQERGISLEDAARSTRIRIFYLQALEADDLASLPSPAHSRGFLRMYADYLGLDSAELLRGEPLPRSVVKQPVFKANSNGRNKKRPISDKKNEADLPAINLTSDSDGTGAQPSETITTPIEEPASNPVQAATAEKPVTTPQLKRKAASKTRIPQYPAPEQDQDDVPKTSQEMFIEIGSMLRERRESLNLTMDEVERFTHLRLHHLKTLENGHMEELSSPVQARGMLSNYARFLNLDDEKILMEYANALQTRRLERVNSHTKTPQAKTVSRPGISRFITLDLVIGIILIIAMAGFLLWGLSQVVNSQKQAAVQSTLPSVSDVLAVSPTDTPGGATPSAPAATASLLPNGTQTGPVDNPNGANPTVDSGSAAAGGQNPASAKTPSGGGKPTVAGAIQVYIIAKNSAWMKVSVDGQTAFMGRIIPGNAYTFNANKKLEVLTGDASALQVLYNQNDLGSLGVLDQVIDLIFTDKGQVYPTPTITPTPTKVLTSTNGPTPTGTPSAAGKSGQTKTATPLPAYSPTPK